VFGVLYGVAGIFAIPSLRVSMIYLAVLAAQLVLVRQAAANYGSRFVTTVLARKTGKEVPVAKLAKNTNRRVRKPKPDTASNDGA
jgi:hypothetical protein